MTTQQELRQASVRAITGTTYPYEGDWHALFDAAGIGGVTFDERLLAWINHQIGIAYTDLPAAMQAYAVAQGVESWAALGTFTATAVYYLLLQSGDRILLETGTYSLILQ